MVRWQQTPTLRTTGDFVCRTKKPSRRSVVARSPAGLAPGELHGGSNQGHGLGETRKVHLDLHLPVLHMPQCKQMQEEQRGFDAGKQAEASEGSTWGETTPMPASFRLPLFRILPGKHEQSVVRYGGRKLLRRPRACQGPPARTLRQTHPSTN